MEPNTARAEAERWVGISAKLLSTRDLVGSRSFAIRAKDADPTNPFPDQILAVVDTLAAAEKRVISSTHYDWYSILHLSHLARDPDLISSQYRRLVFLLNPDHNRFPFADFALRLVVDAWSVLSDPTKKWIYDSELSIFLQRSSSAESVRVDSAATYQFFQPPAPEQPPQQPQQWIHHLQQQEQQQSQLQERQLFQQQQHSQAPPQQPQWLPQPEPEPQPPPRPQQQPHWPPQPEPQPPPRPVQQPQWPPQPQPEHEPTSRPQQQLQWPPQPQPEPQPPPRPVQQPQWLPQPEPQPQPPSQPPTQPQWLPQPQPHPPAPPQRLPEQHRPAKPKEPQFPAQLPQRLPEQKQPPKPKEPQIPSQPSHRILERQQPPKPKEPQFPAQLPQPLPEQQQPPRPKEPQIPSQPPHQPLEQHWPSKPKEQQIPSQPPEQHRPSKPRELQIPSQIQHQIPEQNRPPKAKEPQIPSQSPRQEPRQAPPQTLPVRQPSQQQQRERQDRIGGESNVASEKGTENVSNKDSHDVGGNQDGGGADGQIESFWTGCPYCYHLYEYLKVFQECTLRCQNCRRGFHALEVPKPPSVGGSGKEGSFCSWSFFPLGFSMTAWKKSVPFGGDAKGPSSTWVPFSPMFACPVQPPKQKVVRSLDGGGDGDDGDDFDVSGLSEGSDSSHDWGSTRKRKRQESGRGRRGRGGRKSNAERERTGNQTSVGAAGGGVNAENPQRLAEMQRNVNHEVGRTKNDVINKAAGSGNVRKQMGKGVRGRKKLDLNVEFSNEVEDHANAVNAGNGEEVVGFFEGLDEFLSTLPILHVVGDDKAKPS